MILKMAGVLLCARSLVMGTAGINGQLLLSLLGWQTHCNEGMSTDTALIVLPVLSAMGQLYSEPRSANHFITM